MTIRPATEADGNDCVVCWPTIVDKTIVRPVGLHVVELARDERGGVTFRLCPEHMLELAEGLGTLGWRSRPGAPLRPTAEWTID